MRSTELAWQVQRIAENTPSARVNLICYAVGGLDCRYLVSPGGLFKNDSLLQEAIAGQVSSITTVSTPHRGTDVASAALYLSDEVLGTLLGARANTARTDPEVVASLEALTPSAMNDFNREVTDAAGVDYRSWAGVTYFQGVAFYLADQAVVDECQGPTGRTRIWAQPETRDVMSDLLVATAPFAGRTLAAGGQSVLTPHDGMVSVDSARWGGFEGCVAADHYDVIGQVQDGGVDPVTGFDAGRFYVEVMANLARAGH